MLSLATPASCFSCCLLVSSLGRVTAYASSPQCILSLRWSVVSQEFSSWALRKLKRLKESLQEREKSGSGKIMWILMLYPSKLYQSIPGPFLFKYVITSYAGASLSLQNTTSLAFTTRASGLNIRRGQWISAQFHLRFVNFRQNDWYRCVVFFCHLLGLLSPFTCSPAGAWWWVYRARESFSPASASGSLWAVRSSSSAHAGSLSGPVWSSACSSQLPCHIYYTDNKCGMKIEKYWTIWPF